MSWKDSALAEVAEEFRRQDEKFGDQSSHSYDRWMTILVEEVGELARAIEDLRDAPPYQPFVDYTEPRALSHLMDEARQVAAVALRFWEQASRYDQFIVDPESL